MKKRMRSTQVSIDFDMVYIAQPSTGDGEQVIEIQVDQVDLLVKWLKEAQEEINGLSQEQ